MARYISPVPQYFDAAGDPLAFGKLFFFISGTDDPLATFADVNETIPNTQPVVLTGDGRVPNIFFSGSAKVILEDQGNVQFWSKDPVSAGGGAGSIGDDWDAISIYQIDDVVNFEDRLYVSIINANQNNNPSTSPTAWTQFDLLKRWNINETYSIGDAVTTDQGTFTTSILDNNLGNDPDADDGTNWNLSRGAYVFIAASQTIPPSTPTILSFDSENYDTNSFHDNSVNNSRFTIPTGVTRVRFIAQTSFVASTGAERSVSIQRNGSSIDNVAQATKLQPAVSAGQFQSFGLTSAAIDVIPGDFFEVVVFQDTGFGLDIQGVLIPSTESLTWFAVEVVK